MKKFDWSRYYEDLEEGDPAKFPYWQFAVHEFANSLAFIVQGFVIGFVLVITSLCTIGVTTKYLENHPDFVMKIVCQSYNK